ncbi:MAG: hypothetical protein WAJ93_13250, partial [Candidatus Nitrosopolaris sp.]
KLKISYSILIKMILGCFVHRGSYVVGLRFYVQFLASLLSSVELFFFSSVKVVSHSTNTQVFA